MLFKNVKLFATVSFLLTIVSLSSIVFAQLAYYGIDVVLDEDGLANVDLTLTFKEPVKTFNTTIIGRVDNFTERSNAGSVDCNVDIKGTSEIGCSFILTKEQRTVTFSYNTPDFVKQLDEKFFFSNDFAINKDIDRIFASIRLPTRMAVVKDGRISFPESADILSEGTIVIWSMTNFNKDQDLKLEVLYERLPVPFLEQLSISKVIIFALVVGAVMAFLLLRYFRKSEQLVLSVLDDFERKVIDVISVNGGEVNQRKVVQDTNLSKAKISRVVKSLAERGLIEVQRLGRTNKLKLIKGKLTP